ncbi:SKP1-like protein 21 isoform X1 [Apium graveolens]|uniref:SKP1-like protein 21 isoform X1 n=1 Tax=Apium graveolens TaxID=4045 RepID=UPI003D793C59
MPGLSQYICDALDRGFGFNWRTPICLPPDVEKEGLEMVFDYFRFAVSLGRDCEERELFIDELLQRDEHSLWSLLHAANCLQVSGLYEMIRDTLAQNTKKSVSEREHDLSRSFKQCAKGEELEPHKNVNIRARLSNKLFVKQTKKLDEVPNIKNVEAAELEPPEPEACSIDDLLSFTNGDGDTRGGQTSKKKKKNRNKGKEKKKTSCVNVFASTEASALEQNTENSEQDLNASNSAYDRGSAADRLQLLGTQHESFNPDGDIVDNDLDPALLEGIDREVEDFEIRLMTDALGLERNEILQRLGKALETKF